MKTKSLFLAVCFLAILSGLASWLTSRDSSTRANAAARTAGESLLEPDLLRDIDEIHIEGGADKKVVLRKAEESWTLPEYFGLPVDFDKLSRFTTSLLDAEIARFVTSNPESLARLNLGKETVRLLGSGDTTWKLQTGDSGRAGGNFVRINDEDGAYLTKTSLFVDATSSNWPIKRPLTIEEVEVARVELVVDGNPLAFSRAEADGAFAGENLAENETAISNKVSQLVRTLTSARFTEAVDPANADAVAASEHATPVTLELFDGARYTLTIGRRPGSPGTSDPDGANDEEAPEKKDPKASASVVIDQDGKIVPPEEIAKAEQAGGGEKDDGEAPEKIEPGPVFIWYQSEAPDFVWNDLKDRVALKFGNRVYEQLPSNREDLITKKAAKETAKAETASGE